MVMNHIGMVTGLSAAFWSVCVWRLLLIDRNTDLIQQGRIWDFVLDSWSWEDRSVAIVRCCAIYPRTPFLYRITLPPRDVSFQFLEADGVKLTTAVLAGSSRKANPSQPENPSRTSEAVMMSPKPSRPNSMRLNSTSRCTLQSKKHPGKYSSRIVISSLDSGAWHCSNSWHKCVELLQSNTIFPHFSSN